jgi:hypothetical protein
MSQADELQFGLADEAIEEGLLRAEEEVLEHRLSDLQMWIFCRLLNNPPNVRGG